MTDQSLKQDVLDELARERQAHRYRNHQSIRPDLGHRDFERRQWHGQQVIHGAMFTFSDNRRSRENDGQHGHIVDDTHHGCEPCRRDIRIERSAFLFPSRSLW
jgi:hypothetical protein